MPTKVYKRESNWRESYAFIVLISIIMVGLLVSALLPRSNTRKYPDRVEVRFWHMWTGEWKDVVDRIADRFNESQTEYEIVPLSVPPSVAESKFVLAVAGKDPPDVMCLWGWGIPKWADSNLLTPLETMMTPEEWLRFRETVYPAAQKMTIYRDHLYAVPNGLATWACYYNVDLLAKEGLEPSDFPQSLEELLRWGHRLNRVDRSGRLLHVGFLPQEMLIYAPLYGQGFYDWERQRIAIRTPDNLKCLQMLADEYQRLGLENVLRFEAGLAELRGGGSRGGVEWPFIGGAYTITVDGSWRVQQLAKFAPEVKYGVAPLPPPRGGRKYGGYCNGNTLVIPRHARHVEGAWEFLKFWSGIEQPERAAEFYTWGGWLPISPAVANAPAYKEYVRKYPQFQAFLDVISSENLQVVPPVPYQVYLIDEIYKVNSLCVRGDLTPDEALRKLEGRVMHEIEKRKRFGYRD